MNCIFLVFAVFLFQPFNVVNGVNVNELSRLIRKEELFLNNEISKAESERLKTYEKAKAILNNEYILVKASISNEFFHLRTLAYDIETINDNSYFSPCTAEVTLSKREAQLQDILEKSETLKESCHALPNCQSMIDDLYDSLERIHRNIPDTIHKFNQDLKMCVKSKIWDIRIKWNKIMTNTLFEDQFPFNISPRLFLIWGSAGIATIFLFICLDNSIYWWFINRFF